MPTRLRGIAPVTAAKPGEVADGWSEERMVVFNLRTLCITLLGVAAFAVQPWTDANASPLFAGGSYQFEDHSGDNKGHKNRTLDGIDLSFGSFASSDLKNTSFIGAIFVETDFSDADLLNTNLQNVDLTDSIFSSGTNLKNANLTNAVLIGVDLTGVDFKNAIFIGATYDSTTILTFDPVGAGMVLVPELSPLTLIMLGLLILAPVLKHEQRRVPAFAPSGA
jgi:hypothetical protein